MNRNILFLLFILLIGVLHIREGFREGQINPKVSKKQLDSCKAAKSMWDKRKQNTIFAQMAMKMGFLCRLPPCGGNQTNDWKCQPPPPPPKSTALHKKSCDAARSMWSKAQGKSPGVEAALKKMAVNVGRLCLVKPCGGNSTNDWRCQDGPQPKKSDDKSSKKPTEEQRKMCKAAKDLWKKRDAAKGNMKLMLHGMAMRVGAPCIAKPCSGGPPAWECKEKASSPPPPPAKSSEAQRKSCKAARNLWKMRTMPGGLGLAMRTKAMLTGLACSKKPCSGGPANDWKCQDESTKEGMTPQLPCSDRELKEIKILENRLKAAKNRCSENSASSALDGREGFREGQIQRAREVDSRGRQQNLGTQEQIKSCDAARLFYEYESPSWNFLDQCTRRYRPCTRGGYCDRDRQIQIEREAKRREDSRIRDTARAVGQACTTCGGSPANNWNCTGEGVKDGNPAAKKMPGPTKAQQDSCTAAKIFFAKRNEDPAMLAKAMEVGTLCNSCGGNPENNYTCTATRQAAAAKAGATAPSSTAVAAAGAAPPRCSKCDSYTIARNLGDQYKNDPNICNTRKDEAQCADAGGLWNDEVASNSKKEEGTGDWKVEIDKKSGDLVFNYKGQTKSKLTKTGEWSSDSRKCGTWNIRKDRIGIPGRGDIHLHTDGWQRAFKYDAPYGVTAYNKGGFAGRELWYGGSAGGKLTK